MKTAEFRFYEELNDFLPVERRKTSFSWSFWGKPAIKDAIEALGVPHSEIDLILVNGDSVSFDYRLQNGDRISVYPVFESIDISPLNRLRPEPLRCSRFVLDVNLGKCARLMRLLGFDCLYSNRYFDREIVAIAHEQARIILTRDVGLLKIKDVTHGYWVRSTKPPAQVREVLDRLDLRKKTKPFSRCLLCNGLVNKVAKRDISHHLLPNTRQNVFEFRQCETCHKVYWQGPHYANMNALVQQFLAGDLSEN